uniref:Uncharacterized protein n=2 Tax=Canis lupus familiaris TaxID=9615 RepID=A0A8C0NZ95_CANLF
MKVWLKYLMKFYSKCFPKFHLIKEQQENQLQREKSKKVSYPPVKSLKNTELISSSNNREQHLAKLFAASVAGYSTEPRFLLGSMDRISINLYSGRRDKEPSLVNGNINERLTTGDEEGFQEAVRTDILRQTRRIMFLL